jgi:hypothetical protein
MPAVLAETRIATEQQSIDEIDRDLERLDTKLRKALLLTDNEDEVAQLDADIASLRRKRDHHLLRIHSLKAQQALEQKATAAKQKARLIGRSQNRFLKNRRSTPTTTGTIAST